jgi:hypothetical protein
LLLPLSLSMNRILLLVATNHGVISACLLVCVRALPQERDRRADVPDVGDGRCGDKPVAEYDGDGKADLAYYRASDHNWYIKLSTTGATSVRLFGTGASDVRSRQITS